MKTSWVSQTEGAKWVEFEFPEDIELGCIQFINGWLSGTTWKGLVSNYRVEFHDGTNWKSLASYDANDGTHDFSRDFQTFGLEWSKDSLVFYHNGREIRRQPNTFCHSPAPVCLSAAITPWAGPTTDAISGTFMEVDFVRIYQKK